MSTALTHAVPHPRRRWTNGRRCWPWPAPTPGGTPGTRSSWSRARSSWCSAVVDLVTGRAAGPTRLIDTMSIAFLLGVFGFVVAHRLTTALRRTRELAGTVPVDQQSAPSPCASPAWSLRQWALRAPVYIARRERDVAARRDPASAAGDLVRRLPGQSTSSPRCWPWGRWPPSADRCSVSRSPAGRRSGARLCSASWCWWSRPPSRRSDEPGGAERLASAWPILIDEHVVDGRNRQLDVRARDRADLGARLGAVPVRPGRGGGPPPRPGSSAPAARRRRRPDGRRGGLLPCWRCRDHRGQGTVAGRGDRARHDCVGPARGGLPADGGRAAVRRAGGAARPRRRRGVPTRRRGGPADRRSPRRGSGGAAAPVLAAGVGAAGRCLARRPALLSWRDARPPVAESCVELLVMAWWPSPPPRCCSASVTTSRG